MGDSPTPVYAVYYPEDICKSPREVFPTVKEAVKFANSPLAKSNGARFRKFGTTEEAHNFLSGDSIYCSPLPSSMSTDHTCTPAEPGVPFPSLTKIQLNEFKKTIESKQEERDKFLLLIDDNPRYLVNSGADTATIIMEGFRYNALHIAAKIGRYWFVEQILKRISDLSFLSRCYGLPEQSVEFRRQNIILSYLNTPDKGNHDTPLIIAAKFGFVDVVRLLVKETLINRDAKNKESKTALDVICSRYHGEDKGEIEKTISTLISAVYVAIYRSGDNQVKPVVVTSYPKMIIRSPTQDRPVSSDYSLAGCAGPFESRARADDFLSSLQKTGSDLKKRDIDKGYERVARDLCDTSGVSWSESWFFLGNDIYDFTRADNLNILDRFLSKRRLVPDPIRKKLTFDDSDEDTSFEEYDMELEEFEDALDNNESEADCSLASLVDKLDKLSLNSPVINSSPEHSDEFDEDMDEFRTPPSTPPPVFVLDEPTKTDNDLFLALSRVPTDLIANFVNVRLFIENLSKMNTVIRADWPAKDSPRRLKVSCSRRF